MVHYHLHSGQELDLLGRSQVVVSVGGLSGRHSVLAARGLTQECLLGADFLSKHGCVVEQVLQEVDL